MSTAHSAPADTARPDPVLFSEPGGRWRTVSYGPLFCLVVLVAELIMQRGPVHWFGLIFCAFLLGGFVALQVVAGKQHVSVELTETSLRQGAETVPLSNIARVFPEHDEDAWDDDPWQSARALGELTAVPRRRTGIGLKIRGGPLVQAWARDHRGLREQLSAALDRLPDEDAAGSDERRAPSAARAKARATSTTTAAADAGVPAVGAEGAAADAGPAESDQVSSDSGKVDAKQADGGKPDADKTEAAETRAGQGKADTTGTNKGDSVDSEAGKSDAVAADPGKADPGKAGTGASDPGTGDAGSGNVS